MSNETSMVKVKPNINKKEKWYYGFANSDDDLTNKTIKVKQSNNENFPDCYMVNSSLFIDKEDCIIMNEEVGD